MNSSTLEESHERILAKPTRNTDKSASFCWSCKFEGKYKSDTRVAFCKIQKIQLELMIEIYLFVTQLSVEMQNFSPTDSDNIIAWIIFCSLEYKSEHHVNVNKNDSEEKTFSV